jgi:hypothetical protein
MSDIKEFKVTGGALAKDTRRRRKQAGGEQAATLNQVAGQGLATKYVDPGAAAMASTYAGQVSRVLQNNFGPDKAQQFGGKKQSGGNTGATVSLSSTRAPSGDPNAVTPVVSGVAPSGPAPVGGGLTLAPRRKNRISLRAKKGGSLSTPPVPIIGGTRKARKIHLGVKGVTARLQRAKKAKKQAMSAPISQVKAKLESAGVIKKSSKAPESMLRTMYADLLITKKGL